MCDDRSLESLQYRLSKLEDDFIRKTAPTRGIDEIFEEFEAELRLIELGIFFVALRNYWQG